MKMTRDNFAELLTKEHMKVFFNSYLEKPEQYSKVCTIGKLDSKTETFPHMGGFGMWEENNEGNTINEDSMSEGDTVTFTTRRFDKGYQVTWELVQDDRYKGYKNVLSGKGKGNTAKGLGAGLRARLETDFADVLNNGFSNTGYDGVSLFNNSHPLADSGSTSDNLTTGALTDTNLKTGIILMKDTRDEANIKIQARARQLIVPDELEFTANALVNSSGPAGELSNDTNTLPNLQVVVMSYLTSSTAWFLRDPSIENLAFMWREKPWFSSRELQKSVDYFFFGFTRFDTGYLDWRGLIASDGT